MVHRRVIGLSALAVMACAATAVVGSGPAHAAGRTLSINVVGNHFVDGSGHRIRLLGVNHTSSEYGCVDGFGYDDGHFNSADAAAIASWGANAVRIPLNEDCWLGINGQPNSSEGANPPLTASGYRQEIERYVHDLNARGIYAILDLHWTAPGSQVPLEQQPMPDADHSPAFWSSVAATFKANRAVVFDLFNEPYDPTDRRSGDDLNPADKVTWNCWETGTTNGPAGGTPCFTQAYNDQNQPTTRYQIAGLQTLLDKVRGAGATQPVMAGGLDFANDLGDSDHGAAWMNHAPNDPLNREAASFHNYMGEPCDSATCWKRTIAPIAAHVPVVTGEFDEDNFDQARCHEKPSTFDAKYMRWADSAGVSYLAWGWIVETRAEQNSDRCSAFVLINNYSHYTPAKPNGVALYHHLRDLAKPRVRLTRFSASVLAHNKRVGFRLRSAEKARGTLTGRTTHAYAVSGGKPRHLPLGRGKFALKAGKAKTVDLRVAKATRRLLARKHSLKVRITLVLTSPHHRRTVVHHAVTLHAKT